jgi:transcriptional regulator with XRE-family HTH domain
MINLVEIKVAVVSGGERPDPEVQAGRALRRLRLSRGWSQEEVARRMQAYGYDFHQTMIAKIEAAQRPLRVRELADFAALYGVEVQQLIYPSSSSAEEVAREITEVELRRTLFRQEAKNAAARVSQAKADLADAENQRHSAERELAMLDERVGFLRQEMSKFSPKPDPSAVGTAAELSAALQEFRVRAGNPSDREIAKRAANGTTAGTINFTMGTGNGLPGLNAVRAVIKGCGGSEKELAAWEKAWLRVRSAAR